LSVQTTDGPVRRRRRAVKDALQRLPIGLAFTINSVGGPYRRRQHLPKIGENIPHHDARRGEFRPAQNIEELRVVHMRRVADELSLVFRAAEHIALPDHLERDDIGGEPLAERHEFRHLPEVHGLNHHREFEARDFAFVAQLLDENEVAEQPVERAGLAQDGIGIRPRGVDRDMCVAHAALKLEIIPRALVPHLAVGVEVDLQLRGGRRQLPDDLAEMRAAEGVARARDHDRFRVAQQRINRVVH